MDKQILYGYFFIPSSNHESMNRQTLKQVRSSVWEGSIQMGHYLKGGADLMIYGRQLNLCENAV